MATFAYVNYLCHDRYGIIFGSTDGTLHRYELGIIDGRAAIARSARYKLNYIHISIGRYTMNGQTKYMQFLDAIAKNVPGKRNIVEAVKTGFLICLEGSDDNQINPEKGHTEQANYKVSIWPGSGYTVTPFAVTADDETQALEKVASQLIKEGKHEYFITDDEYIRMFADELAKDPEFSSDQYIYIDGTTEGAEYPIYINAENLKIEKVRN